MTDLNRFISEAFLEFKDTIAYAMKYVNENLEELERKYGTRYLAIANKVGFIDSDLNKDTLTERLKSSGEQRPIVINPLINLTKPKISNN